MKRYRAELSYRGTAFLGWQKQKEGRTVQGTIEDVLSSYSKEEVTIVGCGRTDTGVHAKNYTMHFDTDKLLDEDSLRVVNKMLPSDIAIHGFKIVADEFHARFDAKQRSYSYYISQDNMPFGSDQVWQFSKLKSLDHDRILKAANLLSEFDDFYTFCKSHSDVDTYKCSLAKSIWQQTDKGVVYQISANRFLRGMVRLIVGMLIRIGENRITIQELRSALEEQKLLKMAYSAPASGLFLDEVSY